MKKSSGSKSRKQRLTAVGTRCADHVTPLYPQKLALTSPTGGGRSVGIVCVRTKATEFSLVYLFVLMCNLAVKPQNKLISVLCACELHCLLPCEEPTPEFCQSILNLLCERIYSISYHRITCHMYCGVMIYHTLQMLFDALRYKPEGRGFDSRCCHLNFSLKYSFRTIALGYTQPLT